MRPAYTDVLSKTGHIPSLEVTFIGLSTPDLQEKFGEFVFPVQNRSIKWQKWFASARKSSSRIRQPSIRALIHHIFTEHHWTVTSSVILYRFHTQNVVFKAYMLDRLCCVFLKHDCIVFVSHLTVREFWKEASFHKAWVTLTCMYHDGNFQLCCNRSYCSTFMFSICFHCLLRRFSQLSARRHLL